jgi:Ca2+-binding EF-hand superfamily protein
MKTLICATVIGLFTSFWAIAEDAKSVIPKIDEVSRKGDMARLEQQKKKERFTAADEDGNGVLSHQELAKHFPYIELNFDRYDLNKDGVLSWTEFGGRDK